MTDQQFQQPQHQHPQYAAPTAPPQANRGRTFSIIGAVCGVVALLFFPIILGPAGAVLGFVGHSKGDKPLGLIVGIGSIVTTIAGFAIGAALFMATQGQA